MYSPNLRLLAKLGSRLVAWKVVGILRSRHPLIPLLRLLRSSVSVLVGDDVRTHNLVSALGSRIKQSRCRQGNNITSFNAKDQVIRNGDVRIISCKKMMVFHGCPI